MYSPNHIKHKITNLQLVMQLKPEKKRLLWEDDYNPKNRIFKFNIIIYTNIPLDDYKALVTQSSKYGSPPLRVQALYGRSDSMTKEFLNTLPKVMGFLPQGQS